MGCPNPVLLEAHAEQELRGARRSALEAHLARCPACRRHVAEVSALREALRGTPSPRPDPQLPQRIAQACAPLRPEPSLTCRQVAPLLAEALDGALAAGEDARLWGHLWGCARCLRRYRQGERLVRELRRPAPAASPALLGRIYAALEQVAPVRRPAGRSAYAGVAAAVGLAVLLGALWLGGRTAPRGAPAAPLVAGILQDEAPAGSAAALAARPEAPSAAPAGQPRLVDRAARGLRAAYRAMESGGLTQQLPAAPTAVAWQPPPVPAAAYYPLPEAPRSAPAAAPVLGSAPPPAPVSAGGGEAQPRITLPAPAPPVLVATVPPAPPAPVPEPVREVTVPSGGAALVTHNPPQETRQLRWIPVQPEGVVVFQREPQAELAALTQAEQALNNYGRKLHRTGPQEVVINH